MTRWWYLNDRQHVPLVFTFVHHKHTILELLVQRRKLDLEALSVEGVVLRLLRNGRDQVVLFSDLSCLHDLNRTPLRSAPVVSQVQVADALSETLDDLLHRSSNVWPVCKDNIDVRLLQALERALQPLDDMLSAEATSVRLLTASAEEDLGGKNVFVTRPCELF